MSSAPDANSLHQAALTYLARYAATEAGVRRVLTRQVERWEQTQTDPEAVAQVIVSAREAIEAVIARLVEAGAISDTAFAENRAKSLVRGGRSSRAVQTRLIAKGVAADVAREVATSDAETELAAALVLVRKRRIGPYRTNEDADAAVRMKEMGLLARAGFSRAIAEQALDMAREDADARIFDLRR
jgi:regulatory protein